MDGSDLVFAYGSLIDGARGQPCTLSGWRRGWGVAMDNRRTLPGYRYFLDRETGGQQWPEEPVVLRARAATA